MYKYELIKAALSGSEKLQSFYNIKDTDSTLGISSSEQPDSIESSFNNSNTNSLSDNLIDYSVFSEMVCNIGDDKMKTLLSLFIRELSDKSLSLRTLLVDQSYERLQSEVFMLNRVCNTFGAIPLAKLLKRIELLACQKDRKAFFLIKDVEKLIQNTVTEINSIYLKENFYII